MRAAENLGRFRLIERVADFARSSGTAQVPLGNRRSSIFGLLPEYVTLDSVGPVR
jgi:hypothetical protein